MQYNRSQIVAQRTHPQCLGSRGSCSTAACSKHILPGSFALRSKRLTADHDRLFTIFLKLRNSRIRVPASGGGSAWGGGCFGACCFVFEIHRSLDKFSSSHDIPAYRSKYLCVRHQSRWACATSANAPMCFPHADVELLPVLRHHPELAQAAFHSNLLHSPRNVSPFFVTSHSSTTPSSLCPSILCIRNAQTSSSSPFHVALSQLRTCSLYVQSQIDDVIHWLCISLLTEQL
ncbi:hypothetical protein C8J57DRAFT_621439 [Mycena rebaudengoi]|nr:hypothetical protein C8J57DRAFT_621439 [Mycena rebaudengoi]